MSSNPPPEYVSDRRQGVRFATGSVLTGRYEILDRIDQGGTAEVFRARDSRLDRVVAIKVLRPQYGQDPEARARFEVEARSSAALAVPNIVPVYDFGAADDGSLFIVMRFIDGPSLRHVLAQRGQLPPEEAVEIGRQVADALVGAHDAGLIHRDVKPGNILIDAAGTAHLTDFGIVKALAGAQDLTRAGMAFGTAAYLSPEQATGGAVGPRTDLYALGVVLYEALAGRPPFSGDDPIALSYRHAHETPTALAVLLPGIDAEVERVVMQCLEKVPERRPSSAREVADALGSIGARLATGAATARAEIPGLAWDEADTVVRATISPEAMAADWSARVTPGTPFADAAPLPSSPPSPYAPQMRVRVAPAPRPIRASRQRRGGTALATAIVLLAIGLVALVGAVVVVPALLPGGNGGVANASATPRATRTSGATLPVILPPITTATATAVESPSPVLAPSAAPPIEPPIEPTTAPLDPTPQVTPASTPQVTPAPPPPIDNVSVRIEDEWFVGDYDQGSGRYHGRSASWVYGQGTPYHTMTAQFPLGHEGQVIGNGTLEIFGLDGENPAKQRMSIVLNGVTIYEGPNPLPDDGCCGPSGPGNWGSAVFEIPGELVQRDNTLVISNLEPNDCTLCSKFVMVDYGVLTYRVQP